MIVPTTYAAALLVTILSMICWGSWANTQKLSGKWRFELFYFDYSFGVLVACVIAAFTFGHGGPRIDAPPPLLGQHNEEIRAELGFGKRELRA